MAAQASSPIYQTCRSLVRLSASLSSKLLISRTTSSLDPPSNASAMLQQVQESQGLTWGIPQDMKVGCFQIVVSCMIVLFMITIRMVVPQCYDSRHRAYKQITEHKRSSIQNGAIQAAHTHHDREDILLLKPTWRAATRNSAAGTAKSVGPTALFVARLHNETQNFPFLLKYLAWLTRR